MTTCHVHSSQHRHTHSYIRQLLQAPAKWTYSLLKAKFLLSSAIFTGLHDGEAQWMNCWQGEEGPQGPVQQDAWLPGCHQHQLQPLSFPWWMLCMDLCRNPQGSSLTGPETRLAHTHSGLEALFPLLWQCVTERSDVIERVKAQHSDSDSEKRRTLLVSFPVVVETCWDFLSNKTTTHQSPLAEFQSVETTHLIHSPHGSTL